MESVYLSSSGGSVTLCLSFNKSNTSLNISFSICTMKELDQLISEVSSSAR